MFKNPEYNAVKIVLLMALVALAGWFVYGKVNSGNAGLVIRPANRSCSGADYNVSLSPSSPAAHTIVGGTNDDKVASFIISASSNCDIRVDSIGIASAYGPTDLMIKDRSIYDGAKRLAKMNNLGGPFPTKLVIPKGTSKTIDLYISVNKGYDGHYQAVMSEGDPVVTDMMGNPIIKTGHIKAFIGSRVTITP